MFCYGGSPFSSRTHPERKVETASSAHLKKTWHHGLWRPRLINSIDSSQNYIAHISTFFPPAIGGFLVFGFGVQTKILVILKVLTFFLGVIPKSPGSKPLIIIVTICFYMVLPNSHPRSPMPIPHQARCILPLGHAWHPLNSTLQLSPHENQPLETHPQQNCCRCVALKGVIHRTLFI